MTTTTLATHGFEIHPLFDPADIAAARDAIHDHMSTVARALLVPFEKSRPELPLDSRLDAVVASDRSYAELLWSAVCTDAQRRPEVQALLTSPRFRERARALLGREPGETTVRIRANVPALAHRRQSWHSDVALDDGSACARIRVTAWIPLMDVDATNGTLEIAEGRLDAPLAHEQRNHSFEIPENAIDGAPRHVVECSAGDAVFLDRFTPHRSVPNTSGRARYSVVAWIKPAA